MMKFQLPQLPYSYDALEPYFDTETMRIHHTKHHQGYTDKLNKAIEGTKLSNEPIEHILREVSKHSISLRNNAGGYFNHRLFWNILSPNGGGEPEKGSEIQKAIAQKYSDFDNFKKSFKEMAMNRFGSGWAWFSLYEPTNDLFISSTPNQDNPLMDDLVEFPGIPVLGLDLWEHAYYLKFQNRRADYIDAFFQLVDWKTVERNLETARRVASMA
ncbi:MAG: superoxide dismutase [Lewinellaceae bacterium]|nr:superoxide dismutase [Lewinellaceae bacterium]